MLTVLKFDLAWVGRKLTEPSDTVAKKINTMSEIIDGIIETVQRICSQLRPGLLDDMGLAAAVEWQAKQFAKMAQLDCRVDLDEDIDIDQDYSTVLFRVFQELLTNVVRHAQADTVQISLKEQDGKVCLKVIDDGVGIRQEQFADARSLGLMGIQERVSIHNGSFEIAGSPEKGTTATIIIPIERKGLDNDKDIDM